MKRNAVVAILTTVMMLSLCACGAQNGKAKADILTKGITSAGSAETAETKAEQETEAKEAPAFIIEEHYFYASGMIGEDYLTLAGGNYQVIRLTEEAKSAFPALDSALGAFSDELTERAEQGFDELVESAGYYMNDYQDDPSDFPSGDMKIIVEPVRCDSEVMSFYLLDSCYYPGAAHGIPGYSSYNYNTATGEPIALSDVITDYSALASVVAENLVSVGDGAPVTDIEARVQEYFDENRESLVWTVDRDGIVFRFAPYEVASYAMGTLESRIRFADRPDLFTDKYGAAEGAYTMTLETFRPYELDIDGEGRMETVKLSGTYDASLDYEEYNGIELAAGDKKCLEEAYFFNMKAVFAHTEDGMNYVYVQTTSDNDYTTLYIFEICDEGPHCIGKIDGMGFAAVYQERPESGSAADEERYVWENNSYGQLYPVMDPSRFALGKRTNLLSTYTAIRFYKVGEDGMPFPLTDYYEIPSARTITSLKSMEAELVDPQTGELTGSKAELPEGAACTLWRTNGEDTVDLLLEDGRVFRVHVSGTWPQTVNGIGLDEAFSGTMFAG